MHVTLLADPRPVADAVLIFDKSVAQSSTDHPFCALQKGLEWSHGHVEYIPTPQ